MSYKKISLILILTSMIMFVSSLSAEETDRIGFIGISTAIQSNQLDIMIPIWFDNVMVVVPSVNLAKISGKQSDFGVGILVRFNLKTEEVVPYFGIRGGILNFTPEKRKQYKDYILGVAFGMEYFFKEKFSFGIEAQLNGTKSDKNSYRFGNPDGTTLNTASVAFVSVYF